MSGLTLPLLIYNTLGKVTLTPWNYFMSSAKKEKSQYVSWDYSYKEIKYLKIKTSQL